MSRNTGCLLAVCVWLAVVAPVLAQEPDEPEDAVGDAVPNGFIATVDEGDLDKNLEQWMFGGQAVDAVRKRLEAALVQDIKRFDQKYGLTPAQKKKLELAGRCDLKRFFDRVEEVKAENRRVNGDWNRIGARVFELQRVQNQVFTELFGDESMLVKTLKTNLTLEQVSRHDLAIYRSRVEWMAGLLDKRLKLDVNQHRRLVTLIVRETLPLRRYGDFDYDAIMFQLSRLPQEKLRSALDEAQCRELGLRFDQARRMESILVSEGYLFPMKAPLSAEERGGDAAASMETPAAKGARHE